MQHADAADAPPVRIGRVPPVERLVGIAFRGKLRGGDQPDHAVELARLHEHQRKCVLGAGDVGAAADVQHRDAALGAGGGVDAAEPEAVFLDEFQIRRRGKLRAADGQRLDRNAARRAERAAQLVLGVDQLHPRREQARRPGAHLRAVVVEVCVVGEEIGKGGVAFGRRVGVERDLQHAQERIVFDDKEGPVRHGFLLMVYQLLIRHPEVPEHSEGLEGCTARDSRPGAVALRGSP